VVLTAAENSYLITGILLYKTDKKMANMETNKMKRRNQPKTQNFNNFWW
jgi:hypothetical protein